MLNRAIRSLGAKPRDVNVVSGVGGAGERTLMVSRYVVPGVLAQQLAEAFATGIHRPGKVWSPTRMGDKDVFVAKDRQFVVMYYARDGAVTHIGGSLEAEDDIRRAIERLD